MSLWCQVTAPHFCAGILFNRDTVPRVVVKTAPIVKYMMGWSYDDVKDYCKGKGWKVEQE